MRGKKQSPFAGKTVSLIENGALLLYPRYFSVEEISEDGGFRVDTEKTALGLCGKYSIDHKRKITDYLQKEELATEAASMKRAKAEVSDILEYSAAVKTKAENKESEDNKGNSEEAHLMREVMGLENAKTKKSSNTFSFNFSDNITTENTSPTECTNSADLAVFVGGMPYSWSIQDVHDFWAECGPIADTDCMTFHDSGRFNGIAKITYQSIEGRDSALACDGDSYEGFSFSVAKWKTKEKRSTTLDPIGTKVEGFDVLFMCNLPLMMTVEELTELFSEFNIEAVKLKKDPESGLSKGYAHVHFGLADDRLEKAIKKFDGAKMKGRIVRLGYAIPPPNWRPFKSKVKEELSKGMEKITPENFEVALGQFLVLLTGMRHHRQRAQVEALFNGVSFADIIFLHRTNKKESTGSVLLLLSDRESLAKVLERNRTFHKGRKLHIRPGKFSDYLTRRNRSMKKKKIAKSSTVDNDDNGVDPLMQLL